MSGMLVSDISHGFAGSPVLTDVTLSLRRGETFVVIGPSGTGKTTLLRLLALFEPPDSGTIHFDGSDVWALSERKRLRCRRSTGMVFQQPRLFDTTVRRNVEYGLHIRRDWRARLRAWIGRLGTADPNETIVDLLDIVGIEALADQSAALLSGGEAQRVAFARALSFDPDFLFLDEPTSDLDPRNTAVIEEAIETARRQDRGVVVATHDMNQAERIADRVGVMLNGQLVEVGEPNQIFHDPTDDHVRQFINGELVY